MSKVISAALTLPPVAKEEHVALKMLAEGKAEPHQQVMALNLIVKTFSQPQDLLFIPGSPDETGFINGRAFVAAKIRYYVNLPVSDEN